MEKQGTLRIFYYIERNALMTDKIYELIRVYNIVKEIAGDDLKRDQLKFLYMIHDKVYNTALKDIYLDNL